MSTSRPPVKQPALIVFAKALALGFLGAEFCRFFVAIGSKFAAVTVCLTSVVAVMTILFYCIVVMAYAIARGIIADIKRIAKSRRFDLLLTLLAGCWASALSSSYLSTFHAAFRVISPSWAPFTLAVLGLVMVSSIIQSYRTPIEDDSQVMFLEDVEVDSNDQDVLGTSEQAYLFADAVNASAARAGLVFGLDGPWGAGKSSFIKLAEQRWRESAPDKVIVFHFDILRYAAESDLSQRFIRDMKAVVKKHVFAPEFTSLASRYSRMLRGTAEVSFFGFIKYSIGPSEETIDDALDDIDAALRRAGRRLIIVIDDLDRLEGVAVKNILFAVRRTFNLSQATYILCYDSELLLAGEDQSADARLFLEKFITIKLSLFVESSSIVNFLRRDWKNAPIALKTVPSDTMLKLSSILEGMAELLKGELASDYMALLGDMRKVKRFVNAVLMMQIERTELANTDFHRADLINLILINLNFPKLFRNIYVEETEGRSGLFSVYRDVNNRKFINSEQFKDIVAKELDKKFLLEQLFDADKLELNSFGSMNEEVLSTRACFNSDGHRNLEAYLKLIVRFVSPEPYKTFRFYKEAVDSVIKGKSIAVILSGKEFRNNEGDKSHDKFWSVLINRSMELPESAVNDAIENILDFLPKYSILEHIPLRNRTVSSLLRLLDGAGWGSSKIERRSNAREDIVEIADRIFGTGKFSGKELARRLCENRGVLGWNDLMLFRLMCSADRGGQLFNLQSALLVHEDPAAQTSGPTSDLAVRGMRKLSQHVFDLFRRIYIQPGLNFYAEVDAASDESFAGSILLESMALHADPRKVACARNSVKSFVMYQLANTVEGTGDGVGCGYYDQEGNLDCQGIATAINRYVFDICFDLKEESNALHFADHCLSNLNSGFFSGGDAYELLATKNGLPGGFNSVDLIEYWRHNRSKIIDMKLHDWDREVVTWNYVKTYREGLPQVFDVLDGLIG